MPHKVTDTFNTFVERSADGCWLWTGSIHHTGYGQYRSEGAHRVAWRRAGNAIRSQQTHCVNGHEYTPDNTYWRPGSIASRDCRKCILARVKSYRRRRAA